MSKAGNKLGDAFKTSIDLYQDWILPTNPATKNKFLKPFARKCSSLGVLPSHGECLYEKLNQRLQNANNLAVGHGAILAMASYSVMKSDEPLLDLPFIILNLLLNFYPVLVQLRIRSRIKKILHNGWSTEEEDQLKQMETEVTLLESLHEEVKQEIANQVPSRGSDCTDNV